MSWRLAESLDQLRAQIDAAWPNRNKASDGTIGDASHRRQGSSSDHNPWVDGNVVTALDVTHDPADGVDGHRITEALRVSRDPRLKYVIFDRRIFSSTVSPWTWRAYYGSNPHSHHFHVSVVSTRRFYDSRTRWMIGAGAATPPNEEDWTMPDWVADWLVWVVVDHRDPGKRPDTVPHDLRRHNDWLQPLGVAVTRIADRVAGDETARFMGAFADALDAELGG